MIGYIVIFIVVGILCLIVTSLCVSSSRSNKQWEKISFFEEKDVEPDCEMNSERYCYSWNGEDYYGCYDSIEEALEDARYEHKENRYNVEDVYIGTCTDVTLDWNSNEEKIIESIYYFLEDEIGEWAENFEVTIEQELELAKRIDATVEQWIRDMGIKPSCYQVLDGHLVPLKKED